MCREKRDRGHGRWGGWRAGADGVRGRGWSRPVSSLIGGLNEVGTLAVFSDGGHSWSIGRSTSGYEQKKTTLSGSGVLDERLYLLEVGFHHLETWRCPLLLCPLRVWWYQLCLSGYPLWWLFTDFGV